MASTLEQGPRVFSSKEQHAGIGRKLLEALGIAALLALLGFGAAEGLNSLNTSYDKIHGPYGPDK
jgi:hypothetical protein